MHVVQERLAFGHGTQCGYCSPGFVMSMYALLRNNPEPSRYEIDQAIKGNLCRCTGYRPIVESFYSLSKEFKCCQGEGKVCPCKNEDNELQEGLVDWNKMKAYDPSQEIIFPPKLIVELQQKKEKKMLKLEDSQLVVFCPENLKQLEEVFSPDTVVVSTGITRKMMLRADSKEKWISLSNLELPESTCNGLEDTVVIKANHSLSDIAEIFGKLGEKYGAVVKLLDLYTSIQARNIVGWAGSLLFRNSDFATIALALGLKLKTSKSEQLRTVDEQFFSKRWSQADDGYILLAGFPKLSEDQSVFATKYEKISMVIVEDKKSGSEVVTVGQIGPVSRQFNVVDGKIVDTLRAAKLSEDQVGVISAMYHEAKLDKKEKERPFEPLQLFKKVIGENGSACGRPLAHQYADRHTTGDAKYTGDLNIPDLLHLGFVLSTESHAEIVSVDTSAALAMPGVVDYVDVNDIPEGGTNRPGTMRVASCYDDTPMFAEGIVESHGQVIGAIVAETVEIARRATALVKVTYKKLPPILTLEEAIEKKSFYNDGKPIVLNRGSEELQKEFEACAHVVEGTVEMGGQQHIYMETQSSVVVPDEGGEWTIYTSTQGGSWAQVTAAHILNVPKNKITVQVRRVGGAFGGKAGQCLFARAPALVAANKLKRPVSGVMSRGEDMKITGGRHPVLAKYKIGCDKEGNILAADISVFSNGGWSTNETFYVSYVIAITGDSSYKVPNMHYEVWPCKTNTSTNTAFRGYGHPQSTFIMETAIEHLAREFGFDQEDIREKNLAPLGYTRLNGETIVEDHMTECWRQVKEWANYDATRKDIEKFNKENKFVKRGIAVTSCRFSMTHAGFTEQAFALVHVFMDGTVSVSIGGVEMGQGLNIKCLQVAATVFGLPIEMVTMKEASTEKTANAPVTGGSQGADVHGLAVKTACEEILSGLKPIMKENPEGDWKAWVWTAYQRCIPLSCGKHIKIPRAEFNVDPTSPTYFTTGAVCVVSEVNMLTGSHRLMNVDIVMDTGDSLNPAVDIGQIEGGFTQGYGLLTTEELLWDKEGRLLTDALYKYNIPTTGTMPENFRVMLLKEPNKYGGSVYSSKGIGEPPLLLGAAVFLAMERAILEFAKNPKEAPIFVSPLTSARIRSYARQLNPGLFEDLA
uniref:FAD-binding PCMH-type domain-containing protein n=1 Tax=Steinernema glaseri TaxID=37863 RepID=A0A1I8AU28_9BILA